MSDFGVPVEAFADTCHRGRCGEPLPWDMAAIAINQTNVYCSPGCALAELDTIDEIKTVTVHDPQYHSDRPDGVDSSHVDFGRVVNSRSDAERAIVMSLKKMGGPFRVTPSD